MGSHDMEGRHSIGPNWTPFDALVEVSFVARKKHRKFLRLLQEKSLKKPISVEEEITTAVTVPVRNKRSRFGDQDDDDDDQDCRFELETTAVPVSKRARLGDQDEWCLETQKKKQSCKSRLPIKTKIPPGPNPPPDLPQEFQEKIKDMGGRDKLLVIQKKLFKTDITKGNNRFSIPLRQIVRADFLTEEEKELLRARHKIEVQFIDPMLKIGDIVLAQWDMPKDTGNTSSTYVLISTWNEVQESNGLNIDDVVQLWSFRVNREACNDASSSNTNKGGLCFALVLVQKATDEKSMS
nr:putative b3 domain-containing protein [Quercus suber]